MGLEGGKSGIWGQTTTVLPKSPSGLFRVSLGSPSVLPLVFLGSPLSIPRVYLQLRARILQISFNFPFEMKWKGQREERGLPFPKQFFDQLL